MNEKLLEIWIKVRRKLDQIVLLLLALLLGVVGLFWYLEQQAPAPLMGVPPDPPIPAETPAYWAKFPERWNQPETVQNAPVYGTLQSINVFEERSAASMANLMKRIDQQYQEAKTAFDNNDTTKTEDLIRNIMTQMPSHPQTLELRKLLDARRAAANPIAPAPVPTPPGP